jgi:hypothetical protein
MNQTPTPIAIPSQAPTSSALSRSSGAVISQTVSVKEQRVDQGLCQQCGTQLFDVKTKRKMLVGPAKTVRKPLTIEGRVARGQCLVCNQRREMNCQEEAVHSTDASDLAYALTLQASMMTSEQEEIDGAVAEEQPMVTFSSDAETIAVASNDGATYFGTYNEYGQRHGDDCMLTWPDGTTYHGSFVNGMREGRHGTLCYGGEKGEYVGAFHLNLFHGKGTRRYPSGDTYSGEFVSGHRHGQGKCYFANGDLYNGSWENNVMHGWGRYYYHSGQSYEGHFLNGRRHGKGKYQWTSGQIDIHRYENDQRVGQGVRWSANRKKAWSIREGKVQGRVSLDQAAEIARRCGEVPLSVYS